MSNNIRCNSNSIRTNFPIHGEKMRVSRRLSLLAALIMTALLVGGASSGTARISTPGQEEPITFGIVAPLSPPGEVQAGRQTLNTVRMWAKYVNARGGILGRPVKLVVSDSGGTVAKAVSAMTQRIVNDRVCCIVAGEDQSGVVLAESTVAKRYNVPLGVDYAFDDGITKQNYPQVFRIGPYNTMIAQLFVPFLKKFGYRKVAIFAEGSAYGQGASATMKSALQSAGGFRVTTVQYPYTARDFTPQLTKLAAQKPDAVILAGTSTTTNPAIVQAKEVGLTAQLIAAWDFPRLPDFWSTVGKAGVGIIYPTFYANTVKLTPTGRLFRSLYKKQYRSLPPIHPYLLWDVMNAYKTAITNADSAESAAIVKAIPKIKFEGTTGQITLAHKPGTVEFNQWTRFKQYFKKMNAVGQNDSNAKVIAVVP